MRKLNRRAAAATVLSAGLAACGIKLEEQRELALVCQMRSCICQAVTVEPFSRRATAKVAWRENGDAYCPDGFVLRLVSEK